MCANGLFFFGGQCYEYCNDGTEELRLLGTMLDPRFWSETESISMTFLSTA